MPAETEYRLLGPLAVVRRGATVPIPPGKQQVLLAALLLRAGRLIAMDELAETLWGSAIPASAVASLHNYVARLRRALGTADGDGGGPVIRTEPGGYLIRIAADELDVTRFEAALAAGRSAARAGSWPAAAQVLRAGLALWRGQPLAGLESDVLAAREVPWTRAERVTLRDCLDYAARVGDRPRLIALTAAVAELLRQNGLWAEGIRRHGAAAAAARAEGDRAGLAGALSDLGLAQDFTGHHVEAFEALAEALDLYRAVGDQRGQAMVLQYQGEVSQQVGDYQSAAAQVRESLAIFRAWATGPARPGACCTRGWSGGRWATTPGPTARCGSRWPGTGTSATWSARPTCWAS